MEPTERHPDINFAEEKKISIGDRLARFKKKIRTLLPGGIRSNRSEVHNSSDTPVIQEAQPAEPVSEPIVESAPQVEKLRPAPRLFFHTTPAINLEGIKDKGLIAQGENAVLGRVLGYSLHFGEEHQERLQDPNYIAKRMEERLASLPDDYVMTVWNDNEGIKQKYVSEYTVSPKTESVKDANEYLNRFLGSSPYQHMSQEEYDQLPMKQDIRKLPLDHLRASIPLDRETRELFLKEMILAEKGQINADRMEEELTNYFKDKQMWNADESLRDETIHGLVASIEHSLIRGAVTKRIENIKKNGGAGTNTIKKALEATIIIQSMINDPLSARYLDSAKKYLIEQLTEKGEDVNTEIDQITQKMKARVENPTRSDLKYFSLLESEHQIEFWGATNTEYAQYLQKQTMGFG